MILDGYNVKFIKWNNILFILLLVFFCFFLVSFFLFNDVYDEKGDDNS